MPLNITPSALDGNPVISFSGLATGFDTNAVVNARVGIDQQQITAIQAQQTILTSRQSVYNNVGAALQTLQSVAKSLQSTSSVLPASATSTDPSVLLAAAGSGAAQGSYSILVNSRAQAQSNYSDAYASSTQAGLITAGSLSIAVAANNPISFSIDNNTTLQSLASQINAADPSVAASIINDGSGYRLSVTGRDTGAANTLTFTDAGTGLNLENNQQQNAQDASLSINNSLNVSSPTNTISNAITGVTLQAVNPSATAQTVTIGSDSSALAGDVQNLVSGYNSVISTINQASQFNGSYDPTNLMGDKALSNLQGELQNALDSVSANASGSYSALSQIGVATSQDGTLTINQTQLKNAIDADPQSVAALLSNNADATKTGIAAKLASIAQDFGAPTTGILSQLSQSITAQNNASNNIISDMQNAVNTYRQTLNQQFVSLEKMMSQFQKQNEIVSAFAYQVSGQTNGRDGQAPTTADVVDNTIRANSQAAIPG
jgi:flagellar hook-associated protein 2